MASLTEHVMINKLGDDLDEAITFVGGDTSNVSHIMQYPQIIREQLSAGNIHGDELILEDDTCIIIATDDGRDEYNTRYASGVKSGLIPNSYYLRICTAVQDIEPVYVDLTPIIDLIKGSGEIVDINTIIENIINSQEIKDAIALEVSKQINDINNKLIILEQTLETKVDKTTVEQIVNEIMLSNANDEGINVDELDW